jgi:hypothetical protein
MGERGTMRAGVKGELFPLYQKYPQMQNLTSPISEEGRKKVTSLIPILYTITRISTTLLSHIVKQL